MHAHTVPSARPHEPLRRIVLATDLAAGAPPLFAHALKLALEAEAALHLVHVHDADGSSDWRQLPTVRGLLEDWGVLQRGASYATYAALGLEVHILSAEARDGDVPLAVARRVRDLAPDLLVLGTHARSGLARLLHPSVAEPVARVAHVPALFVGERSRPLVDEGGSLRLRNVVVPLSDAPDQQQVIDALARVLYAFGAEDVAIHLVHVGRVEALPHLALPTRTDWMWRTDVRSGAVVEQVLEAAVADRADLVVMGTHGHDSMVDALLGSTMERVLRRAPVPVLAVPIRGRR